MFSIFFFFSLFPSFGSWLLLIMKSIIPVTLTTIASTLSFRSFLFRVSGKLPVLFFVKIQFKPSKVFLFNILRKNIVSLQLCTNLHEMSSPVCLSALLFVSLCVLVCVVV